MQYKIIKKRPGSADVGSIGELKSNCFITIGCAYGVFIESETIKNEYLEEVKEIKESKVVDSRDDLEEIKGCYVDGYSKISNLNGGDPDENDKSTRETKEQALAQVAKSQLSLLRADTWKKCGDRKPDWENEDQAKYTIRYMNDKIYTTSTCSFNTFLSFPTEEIRDEFLKKHKKLIIQAMPLNS